MEAKELRIRNFVFNQMNQVINVGWEQIKFAEDFNPVPITEEWLLKFGFINNYRQYECDNWGMWVEKGLGDDYIVSHGFANTKSELKSIKYVHQLQNLYFALTGEEIELK